MQGESGVFGQREGAALDGLPERCGQFRCGHFDDRAAPGADRVVVGIVGQSVGGDAALDRQGVHDPVLDEGSDGAVDGGQIGRVPVHSRSLGQTVVDVSDTQVGFRRAQHTEHGHPGLGAPQAVGAEQPCEVRFAGVGA